MVFKVYSFCFLHNTICAMLYALCALPSTLNLTPYTLYLLPYVVCRAPNASTYTLHPTLSTFPPSHLLTFYLYPSQLLNFPPSQPLNFPPSVFSTFRIPTSDFLTLNPLLQNKPLNFTAGRLRDIIDQLDPAGIFICCNAIPDKLLDVFLQVICWLHSGI